MYYDEPGLYTNAINPFPFPGVDWPYLHGCGFEWVTFQAYNPSAYNGVMDFDLAAVRAHGFSNVGIWGVLYSQSDFYNGGKMLGAQAKKLNANHLIIDAEECLKGTRPTSGASNIIRGARDGGWTGPVDLSTLGAPWSPDVNDYAMDTKSFLDTGGSVQSQDYENESEGYTIKAANIYWPRVGVPIPRLQHTIALYNGARGRISGAQWVDRLRESNVGKRFSVYMVQDGQKADYDALKGYIASLSTTPPTGIDPVQVNKEVVADTQPWLDQYPDDDKRISRIRLEWRIAKSTDAQWNAIPGARQAFAKALDDAGVPKK